MIDLKDFINTKLEPLQSNDALVEAQNLFLDFEYLHFPVLENDILIGSIGKEEAEMLDEKTVINEVKYNLFRFFVRENANWFDVFEEFSKNHTNILPILSEDNQYKGFYELDDVLHFLNETSFIKEDGGIIMIEKNTSDYTFSQVCQIVESNNAKILGIFIAESNLETTKIILKITQTNFNEIIQTFRRYNYTILSEHQEDSYLENLKERSDYLTKYLNI
jgi:predicted transcriptional regulator